MSDNKGYYDQGKNFLATGQYDKALSLLQESNRLSPHIITRLRIAHTLFLMGRSKDIDFGWSDGTDGWFRLSIFTKCRDSSGEEPLFTEPETRLLEKSRRMRETVAACAELGYIRLSDPEKWGRITKQGTQKIKKEIQGNKWNVILLNPWLRP